MPSIPATIFKIRYGKTLVPRSKAQWSASLHNIRLVLMDQTGATPESDGRPRQSTAAMLADGR